MTIALDGENPWESYERAGGAFLKNLFEGIRREKIKTTTVGGYLAEHPPRNKITTLYSGSWINSNYAIWIGKPQKNQAWDYIKRAMDELGPKLSDALENTGRGQRELMAMESFGAACGSDFSAKDFRTWAGSLAAMDSLRMLPPPANQTEAKRTANLCVKAVAGLLGNTPAVCRAAYIHPRVLEAHAAGQLPSPRKSASPRASELALLRLVAT